MLFTRVPFVEVPCLGPPTPSTARNDTCTASPADASMRAVQPATSTPRRHARRAADLTVRISRSSAPMAFTVRNDPKDRSSTEPMPPTTTKANTTMMRFEPMSGLT